MAINGNNKRSRGAPKSNVNGEVHGVLSLRTKIWRRARRGRSLIDQRCQAGRNAVAMRNELIADHGGVENMSIAKLALIELIARDVYFVDECDRRIFRAIYKLAAKERAIEKQGGMKNPKLIATLYSYRQGAANNLARNLMALGLEKAPPKVKSLEEILNEEESQPE